MQDPLPGIMKNPTIPLSAHDTPYYSADLYIKIHQRMSHGMVNSYVDWILDLTVREGQLMFWRRVTVKLSSLAVVAQPSRRGALD